MYEIENINQKNFDHLANLALKLWPDDELDKLKEELSPLLDHKKENGYLVKSNNRYIAFIQISIRHDYVEGTDSSPTGYIEGIYVEKEFRKQGIAKSLIKYSEKWFLDNNCTQMASDAELHNKTSEKFHKKIGFEEVNRVICFLKDIK